MTRAIKTYNNSYDNKTPVDLRSFVDGAYKYFEFCKSIKDINSDNLSFMDEVCYRTMGFGRVCDKIPFQQ